MQTKGHSCSTFLCGHDGRLAANTFGSVRKHVPAHPHHTLSPPMSDLCFFPPFSSRDSDQDFICLFTLAKTLDLIKSKRRVKDANLAAVVL